MTEMKLLAKRVKELERENAELRTKVTALENANRAMVKELDDMTSGGISVLENVIRSKEQLTKAKDLLKKMYYLYHGPCVTHKDLENRDKLFEEVKQFIKEIEK